MGLLPLVVVDIADAVVDLCLSFGIHTDSSEGKGTYYGVLLGVMTILARALSGVYTAQTKKMGTGQETETETETETTFASLRYFIIEIGNIYDGKTGLRFFSFFTSQMPTIFSTTLAGC